MPARAVAPTLKSLTAEAVCLVGELDAMGRELEDRLTVALEKAWRLGQKLVGCKALVGHGNWLVWLEANVPLSHRHAVRHMELADENPDAQRVEDLSPESVRKFRLRYVPEKQRPQLEGDESLPRVCHHLTLLNDWRRWQRRVEIGQAHLDATEAKRDLAPLARWICQLYGIEAEIPG